MKKKNPKFYSAEEIKKMVLEEKKLPSTTSSSCDDFIVKSRYPIGSHKRKKVKF